MTAREAGLLILLGSAALVVSVLVYVAGSFWLMRRHAKERPFGITVRELLRETFLALLTQPLLPFYYLVGRRMGGADASGVPVVLVHGYMQNRVGFVSLARSLARRGLGPIYGFNYPWFLPIPDNARRLRRFVDSVSALTGSKVVDLVCHSMGGLVAVQMMQLEAAQDDVKVRRLVTIASPHGGVAWKGPLLGLEATSLRKGSKLLETHAGFSLRIPTLSVFSSHDNVVHPMTTSSLASRGGQDVQVDGPAHLAILFSKEVHDHVARFLEAPDPL